MVQPQAVDPIEVGTLIEHPNKPEWGLGKVLAIFGNSMTIYFKDYQEQRPDDAIKTIRTDLVPLRIAHCQSDPWLDNLPPLRNRSLGLGRVRLTFEQAITHFQRKFPLGFEDPSYIGDRTNGERWCKYRHHLLYLELFGNGTGEQLLNRDDIAELVRRAYRLYSINLLHTQEQIKIREALLNHDAARLFFAKLFALVASRGVDRGSTESYFESVCGLATLPGRRVAAWPTATILPFLADPTRFMFLKPELTRQAAERLAFDLSYDPAPNWSTYSRLLTMSQMLLERLRPLGARDWLDVQSFMWVISDD
jgi:hypothetical protein